MEIFAGSLSSTAKVGQEEVEDNANGEIWWRVYGLEDWTFDEHGKMRKRMMSANEVRITEQERWFRGTHGVGQEFENVDELVNGAKIGEEHW